MNRINIPLYCVVALEPPMTLSHKSYPKQFINFRRESLFQSSARRLSGEEFAAPTV